MKRSLKVISIFLIPFLFVGCNKGNNKKNISHEKTVINMPKSILQSNIGGKIATFQWDNTTFKKLPESDYTSSMILFYDYKNKVIEYSNKNDRKLIGNNFNTTLQSNIAFTRLNSNGDKVFYKVQNDNEYKYYYLDLDTMKKEQVTINLSGEMIQWKDKDTLVFYGVKDNKSGIYSFDINTKKINNISNLENGYINYMYTNGSEIIYLFVRFDGNSEIRFLDTNTQNSNVVEVPFTNIKDIKKLDSALIIKSIENDKENLYLIQQNEINKINYSFPEKIKANSYLLDEDNNILFIGVDEGLEGLYIYDLDNNEIRLKKQLQGENYIPDSM